MESRPSKLAGVDLTRLYSRSLSWTLGIAGTLYALFALWLGWPALIWSG